MLEIVSAGLEPRVLAGLLIASFGGSFLTVSMGIGGGVLLLAVMASLMPPSALIPVHGVIQIGSNLNRALIMARYINWQPLGWFALGSAIGVGIGGTVVVDLPPAIIQLGVGGFIIFSVLRKPPAWLSRSPMLTGSISSFLTMFFGATGVFVANFAKSLNLNRFDHVATHAAMMTTQHALKVLAFGFLGFAFGPWAGFIAAMILAGLAGTITGRLVLNYLSDHGFRRVLDAILIILSLRLIWIGLSSFWS